MGLYLGSSEKLKINLNSVIYKLNLYSESTGSVVEGIMLLSSEGYMLKDINGLYLTVESDENV